MRSAYFIASCLLALMLLLHSDTLVKTEIKPYGNSVNETADYFASFRTDRPENLILCHTERQVIACWKWVVSLFQVQKNPTGVLAKMKWEDHQGFPSTVSKILVREDHTVAEGEVIYYLVVPGNFHFLCISTSWIFCGTQFNWPGSKAIMHQLLSIFVAHVFKTLSLGS